MRDLSDVRWLERFEVDSFQAYFAASLELQEELMSHGFKVPKSEDQRIKTPIPIIYSNFKGWLSEELREPITIERLIPPDWIAGFKYEDHGWEKTKVNNKEAYYIPPEESFLDLGIDKEGNVYLKIDVNKYHLERASIRGVNPDKWSNWIMFYMNLEYLDKIINILNKELKPEMFSNWRLRVKSEKHQGGKEFTYYVYVNNMEDVGLPVVDFSFCLGCFSLALSYLRNRSEVIGLNPSVINELKLRIEYDPKIKTGLKVGIAKILNKRPQLMFKLASTSSKEIKGLSGSIIKGKARGKLTYCDHLNKSQYIIINGKLLYHALTIIKPYINRLPSQEKPKK